MTIAIFYFKTSSTGQVYTPPQPGFYTYEDHEFADALRMVQSLREQGARNVVMSNEPSNMVGKMGVTELKDGMLDDGTPYEWTKQDRAGKTRRDDENKPVRNGEDL